MSTVFIAGTARSCTTALLQALDLSGQTMCAVEPMPNLNPESRHMFDGSLSDPYACLVEHIAPRIARALAQRPFYVEKQMSLVPFMRHLHQLFNCRFIIPIRDGREVVTSHINWHNKMFPIIYQECQDDVILSAHAEKILAAQSGVDPYDYSLPRPLPGDPYAEKWPGFSRLEMVAWYWQCFNQRMLQEVASLPADAYKIIDTTDLSLEKIAEIYQFIGLDDFNAEQVTEKIINRKVNSLRDRINEDGDFPAWQHWTEDQLARFNAIAHPMMYKLGYYKEVISVKPTNYFSHLQHAFYTQPDVSEVMQQRQVCFNQCKKLFSHINNDVSPLGSVIEIAMGVADGYSPIFSGKHYLGIDVLPRTPGSGNFSETEFVQKVLCGDICQKAFQVKADFLYSPLTLNRMYDVNAFLRHTADMTTQVLYLANIGRYVPELTTHQYNWCEQRKIFDNILAPREIKAVLTAAGFATVLVFPQRFAEPYHCIGLSVIASREVIPLHRLIAECEIAVEVAEYVVEPSSNSADDIATMVNGNCRTFAIQNSALVNDFAYCQQVIQDLAALDPHQVGTVAEFADSEARVNIGLRVDVDVDIITALKMAQTAQQHNLKMTFYLLHTAAYYGLFYQGRFYRNEINAELYQQLQALHMEVGLHVDPLLIYQHHRIDGAAAVVAELNWLRSLGLAITGATGHNVVSSYRAENIEIFKQRQINPLGYCERDFVYAPLGVLDEAELGITYDGSFAIPTVSAEYFDDTSPFMNNVLAGDFLRDPTWLQQYLLNNPYCTWNCDYNIWLLGNDLWVIAGHQFGQDPRFEFAISWQRVKDFLQEVTTDKKILITLHPLYLGKR